MLGRLETAHVREATELLLLALGQVYIRRRVTSTGLGVRSVEARQILLPMLQAMRTYLASVTTTRAHKGSYWLARHLTYQGWPHWGSGLACQQLVPVDALEELVRAHWHTSRSEALLGIGSEQL